MRNHDLAYLDLDCNFLQNQNSPSARETEGIEVIAAVISVVVVTLVLFSIALVLVTRKKIKGCLSSLQLRRSGTPVCQKQILQYPEEREPRYVSHYRTLPGNEMLQGQSSPMIRVNPMTGQNMLKHDQYFFTEARQQNTLRFYKDSDYVIDPDTERVYQLQPQEMIYQAVSDTQSDHVSDI